MPESKPHLALMAAVADNGVIGRGGTLPWHLSTDFKIFRKVTMGKPIIMGRRTFESLTRPLDGRDNIVLTANASFAPEGAIVVYSLDQALDEARKCAEERGVDEIVVIGGEDIFRRTLQEADRLYLTEVHGSPKGDTFFPRFDRSVWRETSRESYPAGPRDDYPSDFVVLQRIRSESA
jgi:dihydrofolate reductase